MSDEQVEYHFQVIRRRSVALQKENMEAWKEIDAALEDLGVIYEEMQTNLEAAQVVEQGLLQQNQQLAEGYNYYYDLFQSSPIAYLITDANGVILEANTAIAQLLNVPQRYLAGKPLILYVAEGDRSAFRTDLDRLSQSSGIQVWQTNVCPRQGQPFRVELHIDPVRSDSNLIESLRIGVYNISRTQQQVTSQLQSLDGLQVLIVDDEADAREFITAVLESHGIRVTAVETAAAALETLEQFRPDVLVSDIRMPYEDGYSLIRKVRELEAKQGWHIPAAALTAYLEEDRSKALAAGFESHLHKLAQPTELIEMVTRLAGRAST